MDAIECSYVRLIDSCITQLKAQGPPGTCHNSGEENEVSVDYLDARVANVSQNERLRVDAFHKQRLLVDAFKIIILCGCAELKNSQQTSKGLLEYSGSGQSTETTDGNTVGP